MNRERSFTLFEIILCIGILSMLTSALGWQIHHMVGRIRFDKSIEKFISDLRKGQIVALTDRCDINLIIKKEKGRYLYRFASDQFISIFDYKATTLSGVNKVLRNGKAIKEVIIPIFSQGRIGLENPLAFLHDKGEKYLITFNPIAMEKK